MVRTFERIIMDRAISRAGLFMVIMFFNSFNSFAQEPPPSPTSQPPSVIGNWYLTIQSTEITEAGNDFTGNYESAVNQMLFSRNATSQYKPNWNVTINKSDVFWHSNLKLWIRRTGDGTPVSGATINNGANYLEVLNTPVNFFDGYKEVDEVPLQLKITGLSVIIPANSYYTLLTFTVTEN